ncbi:MAG: DUF1501 domain-containing protein [Pseudomonadota bacterium]
MANISRRHLLRGLGTAGFAASLGSLSQLSLTPSWAADASGYKAMVCIFLKGGMDGADTILPYDQPAYENLKRVRPSLFGAYGSQSSGSSRNRDNLLKLTPDNDFAGQEFAVPRELSKIRSLFDSGDLAIVGNVGPLIEPTTKTDMINGTAILPKRLFSHNDQLSTWMALEPEGAQVGWGGRFMDQVLKAAPHQDPSFSSITTWDSDVFLAGQSVSPFRVFPNGTPTPDIYNKPWLIGQTSEDDSARDKLQRYLRMNSSTSRNLLEADLLASRAQAIENSDRFRVAQSQATALGTSFADDYVSTQMRSIAETIQIRSQLNVSRQMFGVNVYGFDTHNNQANNIGVLHEILATAIASFRDAMIELGEWQNVVVFTASDFGRTLVDNGNGTDHGWGGHHFVAGGAVRGKQIYGDLPPPEVGAEAYTQTRGRLIPSVSVEQYAATMGAWFGLSQSELYETLPNLRNFNTHDLGFMQG